MGNQRPPKGQKPRTSSRLFHTKPSECQTEKEALWSNDDPPDPASRTTPAPASRTTPVPASRTTPESPPRTTDSSLNLLTITVGGRLISTNLKSGERSVTVTFRSRTRYLSFPNPLPFVPEPATPSLGCVLPLVWCGSLEREMQAQVLSSDRGSKLQGPSQNSLRVASKRVVNTNKLNETVTSPHCGI
ncbi:hypothetical protein AVEN_190595-1 [Araneus ventricosus]|uniref:Uncharacterized protein n=1 Tax=Araneus ventricosus TaxID=182803 RepID=A0A4Y2CDY4_ARAVE|nr:hypothetical protein AVEN_190595-1 [Araneus ventricosus]